MKAATYPLKAYSKQTGEFKNSIELLNAGKRTKAIMAKAISFKKRDGTAMLYVGNAHTKDDQRGLDELQDGAAAEYNLTEGKGSDSDARGCII